MKLNKKTKKILIFIVAIIIVILLIFIPNMFGSDKTHKSITALMCEDISNDIKNKDNFIIFIKAERATKEAKDTIDRINFNYSKDINIYKMELLKIKNSCLNKLIDEKVYNDAVEMEDSVGLVYVAGNSVGMISGLDSYSVTENYFIEKGAIKPVEIKEATSFSDYSDNLGKEKYLLLMINDERERSNLTKLIEKYFPNYSYDIVHIKSDEGKKIKSNLEEKNITFNEYPQLLYFEKEKLIYKEVAGDDSSFSLYVSDLNEKLNK